MPDIVATQAAVSVLQRAFHAYLRFFSALFGIKIEPVFNLLDDLKKTGANPDHTLIKLDEAKDAMSSALIALSAVRTEAAMRVVELEEARTALNAVLASKAESEEKLREIQKIANADLATFRKMAGVISPVVAFFSGVFASIVAAVVGWGAIQLWKLASAAIAAG